MSDAMPLLPSLILQVLYPVCSCLVTGAVNLSLYFHI